MSDEDARRILVRMSTCRACWWRSHEILQRNGPCGI